MGKIQLTRADIKYIIERAKQAYVKYPDKNIYAIGLCETLGKELETFLGVIDVFYSDIQEYIPQFNRKYLNAEKGRLQQEFWWKPSDVESRLKAFDKLINCYS